MIASVYDNSDLSKWLRKRYWLVTLTRGTLVLALTIQGRVLIKDIIIDTLKPIGIAVLMGIGKSLNCFACGSKDGYESVSNQRSNNSSSFKTCIPFLYFCPARQILLLSAQIIDYF